MTGCFHQWLLLHDLLSVLAPELSLFPKMTLSGALTLGLLCHDIEICFSSAYTGPLDLSNVPECGIGVLTVKAQPQYAAHHGACKLTSDVRAITGIQDNNILAL